MAPVFYRDIDTVKEHVIPPESGTVVSSAAKEAAMSPNGSRVSQIVGDNRLWDGISVRTPTYMLGLFENWRTNINFQVARACDALDKASSKYYREERRITTTIANLHSDPREELLPGLTYSLVAAMSGSILTRNKNILFRLTAPIAFGAACCSYVLPVTFGNTMDLLYGLEKGVFPRFADGQRAVYVRVHDLMTKSINGAEKITSTVSSSLTCSMRTIKDWTGLNV
ncbi:LAMI_0G02190g1_1 [Lachancea mirantina]|uniref:MICOS complex subunit n=1 Tax=Lachancea mirantina TaxID=1230905 RepID=A0A1G4K7Q3_9SACH|nr:LAMI_0G02190g1_1 [Lachancea mirantina]